MRIKKLLKTMAISMAAMIMFTVPVMAGRVGFSFQVDISDDLEEYQCTDNVRKEDSLNYAGLTYTTSNITTNDDFTFTVIGQRGDNSAYTKPQNVYATAGKYKLSFIKEYYEGNNYRLKGQTYKYYVTVTGDWAP